MKLASVSFWTYFGVVNYSVGEVLPQLFGSSFVFLSVLNFARFRVYVGVNFTLWLLLLSRAVFLGPMS